MTRTHRRFLDGKITPEDLLTRLTPVELCHISAPPKAIGIFFSEEFLVVHFDVLARVPTPAEITRFDAKAAELGRPPTTDDFRSDDPQDRPFATKAQRVNLATIQRQALTRLTLYQNSGTPLNRRCLDAIHKAFERIDGKGDE